MRPDERPAAGLRCSEVMEDLSAYLERDLPAVFASSCAPTHRDLQPVRLHAGEWASIV